MLNRVSRVGPIGLVVLLPMFFLLACQTYNVRSDWDEAASFDRLRRYAWIEPEEVPGADPFADNSLLRKRVRAAIEADLTERGFAALEDPEQADFHVTWRILLDEKLRVNGGGAVYGGYGGYGRWPFGVGGAYGGPADVRDYQEATLVIDFLEPANGDLLWRGWGSGFLATRDRDRSPGRFAAGIKAILAAFPPGE
jgi:Domain of unknown function (DUF4136)